MGVQNLWRVLDKGGAVVKLKGDINFKHIAAAVEHKVVAVDLSAWLMQAQTQPALLANYDSDYARVAKVVFDRTIHWLRHGCLPVFVIEGQTPQAKLDKLRQRCIQQYGPQRNFGVGNRAGGQFDRLGQAVKRLLEAFGVPCVQAVGEGEAMCAALNTCGWAHACHTLDVDALLFGAITVYRQMHLLTDKTKESELTICSREDVQRVLGISRGGDAALTAVAQLAGGDYDLTGVENVGEVLALSAVRHLLRDCESDDTVIQKLEAALTAGPNAELDALTKCTGCKACGHESGTKARIKQHPAQRGCAACGCTNGCDPRDYDVCECEFHQRADDRLLNRVVKLAGQTPGFIKKCRLAADTYREQQQLAITAVQREYGVALPDSKHNVFRWLHRPDVRAIADVMCHYIKDWEYHQVRLKLLPLLVEWDVRQGPRPSPSAGVQFRPTAIRQVSTRGAEDTKDLPKRQQQGWRYIMNVERLPSSSQQKKSDNQAAEDLAIDQAWLDGTARSRPKAQPSSGASGLGSTAYADVGDDCDEDYMYSQGQFTSTQATQQGFDSYTEGMSSSQAAAAGSGGGRDGGGKSGGFDFAEHRSVRCSLVDSVWPELTQTFRNRPATSGRTKKSGGGRKKAAAEPDAHQRTVKDFFGTTKDPYNAARPWTKPVSKVPTGQDGSIIPGLAGITGTHTAAAGPPAAAAAGLAQPRSLAAAIAELAGDADTSGYTAAETAAGRELTRGVVQQRKASGQESFMEWMCSQETAGDAQQQPSSQHHQQRDLPNLVEAPQTQLQRPSAAIAAAKAMDSAKGASRKGESSPAKSAAASGRGRVRSAKPSKAAASMPTGALDRFVSKQQQQQRQRQEAAVGQNQQGSAAEQFTQQQGEQQQQELGSLESPADMCVSPEVLPLAVRLARSRAAGVGRQAADHGPPAAGASAASGGATVCGPSPMPPPAKKASTVREKERLCSPTTSPQKLQDLQAGSGVTTTSSSPRQQQLLVEQHEAGAAAPKQLHTYFTARYQALMDDVAELSPQACDDALAVAAAAAVPGLMSSMAASRLFAQGDDKQQKETDVIDLLDSPVPLSAHIQRTTAAGSRKYPATCEVVDLT